MSAATIQPQGAGRYALSGKLDFATVTSLLAQGRALLMSEAGIEMDLSGVTHADSAGLALLIEWLRQAKLQSRQLRYLNLPAQLQSLASISDVDDLLVQSA